MASRAKTSTMDAAPDESLSVPTRTLLFGPLGSTDVSSAVVHRLRAAIGLGLLADGKRLPKESDLAAQMGITTFALREALAELRKQGLIVTRAGKYGGSFVTHPGDDEDLELEELLSLTSVELRDLGDWRQMLACHAAALAAKRASKSNVVMLAEHASSVGSAKTGLEARRAHGRFHLELASAAQSMRMTRAEFAVHEQIDWLFGLALRTVEQRAESASILQEVAEAIRRHDTERAWEAAERHVSRLGDRLAQLRLELIAAQKSASTLHVSSTLEQEVGSLVDQFASELSALADDVAPVLATGVTHHEVATRVSLAGLQHFDAFPPFVQGIGMVAEVNAVPGRPYWIQNLRRTDAGPVADNHHVLDPAREDFYDYERMEFIARPRKTHKPWAYGPYVDYGGVDDYILTLNAPVVLDGRFYGVSVADILVGDLESWLAPWLATASESYLLNVENRVIVSNSMKHRVGDVMATRRGFKIAEFPVFGWSLLSRRK